MTHFTIHYKFCKLCSKTSNTSTKFFALRQTFRRVGSGSLGSLPNYYIIVRKTSPFKAFPLQGAGLAFAE